MDKITKIARSENMRRIHSVNTKPELIVRKIVSRLGIRYRLHPKNVPGSPDIVNRKHKIAIFVHGCFWHQHLYCKYSHFPKSRRFYWVPKLNKNIQRDKKNIYQLRKDGWSVLVIWECQLKKLLQAENRLRIYFKNTKRLNY
jgi:DNA mismatch endonuclease, patch repair protein